jgi:ADP-ribosylglycohydrolase
MAGAIGGAYFGVEKIPQEWVDCCEESSRTIAYADALFELANKD